MQENSTVLSRITASTFHGFDLKYDELNQRLSAVKKEFGLRRAISTHSLAGETRTFAEILDAQVETIVLYYLEVQGILARQLRILRSKQIISLQNPGITLESIEEICKDYRRIGWEVLELLNYLDRNSIALRKIILRHDLLFDQKMGSLYFDSRLSSQGNTVRNGAQLRQLYRQEGIIAIVASIRRGFEELYDARKMLLDASEDGFEIRKRSETATVDNLHYFGSTSHDLHPDDRKCIPRVPFRKRLASFGNLRKLAFEAVRVHIDSSVPPTIKNSTSTTDVVATEASPLLDNVKHMKGGQHQPSISSNKSVSVSKKNNRSTGNLYNLLNQVDQNIPSSRLYAENGNSLKRSLSDLEIVLKHINEVGQRVMKTQERTTLEFLSDQSEIALEFNIRDMNRAAERSRRKHRPPALVSSQKQGVINLDEFLDDDIKTSNVGLYLNLVVTFLYQANQYIVAPTSSKYANLLGMTAAMSGMIIGFSPAAALVSSLMYSTWSNSSFKSPLVMCIVCATLGNILYGAALQCDSIAMIFLGRLLVGFGGPRVISRRYIADHVSLQDRLIASGQFVSAGALGLVFGPLLASIMARWEFTFHWEFSGITLIQYQSVTAPGWAMALFWFLSLISVVLWFEDPLILTSEDSNSNLYSTAGLNHDKSRVSSSKTIVGSLTSKSNGRQKKAEPMSDEEWGVDLNLKDVDIDDSDRNSPSSSLKDIKVGIADRDAKLRAALDSPEPFVHIVTHVEMTPYTRPKPPRTDHTLLRSSLQSQNDNEPHGFHYSLSTGHIPISKHGAIQQDGGDYEDSAEKFKVQSGFHRGSQSKNKGAEPRTIVQRIKSYCWCSCLQWLYNILGDQLSYYFDWIQYVTVEVQVILFVYLVNKIGQELVVSSAPLLTGALFDWTNEAVGYYMAIVGALVVPTNILVHSMVKDADERDSLKSLTVLAMIGIALVCYLPVLGDYTLLQYLLGTSLGFTMLNAIEGVVMSLLSKLIAPELAKGTFNSGLLATEAGTLGRVVGDMMITVLADSALTSTGLVNRLYIPFLIILGGSLVLAIRFYENLLE